MDQEIQRVQEIYTFIVTFLLDKGLQLAGALVVLLVGLWVARKVASLIQGLLLRHNIDITLSRFAASTVRVLIIVSVAIVALDQIDIQVTPFIAAIGALSLGAGLALQGLLSNYGAGISIILARPFVVGDTITVLGVTGIVKEVKLAYTILENADEVRITIPNRHIIGEIIHNSQAHTIIESSIDIAYGSNVDLAIGLVREACESIEGVSNSRRAQVGIAAFADSGISIGYRYWVPTERQFPLRYQVNGAILSAFRANDVAIPFPQREVRLLQD